MKHNRQHILFFDLYSDGHHAMYLKHLCEFWIDRRMKGKLSIVIPECYEQQHIELVSYIKKHRSLGLFLHMINDQLYLQKENKIKNLIINDRQHGRLARKFIEVLKPTHVAFLFIDRIQLSIGIGMRFDFDVILSGILFRPTIHYTKIGYPAFSWKESIRRFQKKIVLQLALRNRHLRYLFSLDPYATPYLKKISTHTKIFSLPDGYTTTHHILSPLQIRKKFDIESKRRIILFFGVISERKGIFTVLNSIEKLNTLVQKKLCLLIVGHGAYEESLWVSKKIDAINSNKTFKIIWHNQFVEEESIQDYFRCADLSLIPYQRHVGSSHILIRSAAEGVPVLGSDYGLVGKNIAKHHLGLAIDTTNPDIIAKSLNEWGIDDSVLAFDAKAAKAFVDQNSAESFAETIFNAFDSR